VPRDADRLRWLEDLMQDLRYVLRQLRRNPGFTAVAVVTLALGIGANTATFSVVDGVLLSPLPYGHASRLVALWESTPRSQYVQADSYQNFRDWQRDARSFQKMAAWHGRGDDLTSPGVAEHVEANEVSSGFFATLGVKLALGRGFTKREDQRGGARVVIISNRLCRERFNAGPRALGRVVTLDGMDYSVVGVLPRGFRFFGHPDAYIPLAQSDRANYSRADHAGIGVIGLLKSGASLTQAWEEMDSIQNHLDKLYPNADRGLGIKILPLKRQIVGNVGGTLLLMLGAVGLVLLIACANVANLLLARTTARTHEFAIRSALGASRARVARQLLTESVLLSLAGAGLGLLTAVWGLKAVVPGAMPRSNDIHLNILVLLFALGVAVAVGILFGLTPALRSARLNLQEGERTASAGATGAQSGLVVFQMALTLVLLVGASLLLRTIRHLWETNPGFEPRHLVTFKVGLSPSLTKTASSTRAAYQQLLKRIRAVPGVDSAALTWLVPLQHMDVEAHFWFGPREPPFIQSTPEMLTFLTGPDYRRVMGIPLLRGRFFTADDNEKFPPVIVIDSVFAGTYFPGKNPVGQTITFDPVDRPCRIIGIVGHVRHWGLGKPSTYTQAQAYFSLYQLPDHWVQNIYRSTTMIVRTALPPSAVVLGIRKAVFGAGRGETVYDVQTMREIVSDSIGPERFPAILLGMFAGLALLLACVGIYGVISYSVAQRIHEMGIRMALGAQKGDVLKMVMWQVLKLALSGVAIGVAGALALTRFLATLLYGVKPTDPLTFGAVCLTVIGVALFASYLPARRATKVDPMVALRYE
jgi:predicted permease